MNTVGSVVAVILVLGVLATVRERRWDWLVAAAVLAFLGGALACFVAFGLWVVLPSHYEWRALELVGAHDAQQLRGDFFLGSGRIGSETHWVFWYRTGGGIARYDTTSFNVLVFEDATPDTAHLDIGTQVSDLPGWTLNPDGRPAADLYRFHVPPGSVNATYSFGP